MSSDIASEVTFAEKPAKNGMTLEQFCSLFAMSVNGSERALEMLGELDEKDFDRLAAARKRLASAPPPDREKVLHGADRVRAALIENERVARIERERGD